MMHVLTMQEEFRTSFSSHVMEVSFFIFWVQLLAGSDLKRISKKIRFLTFELYTQYTLINSFPLLLTLTVRGF